MTPILCIDFMNLCHRARSGFTRGNYNVVYNFFRQFRTLTSKFKPNRVYVVLEGRPIKRYELLPEYKATRKVEKTDPKYIELQRFYKQKDLIVEILSKYFPVSVIRHPTSECDDTIYNMIKYSSTAIPWIVVSSDTDFIQLIQEYSHVKVWNPIKKDFLSAPDDYDYVTWKALRGDSSDNVPGIVGVGDKKAANIASDPNNLMTFLTDSTNAQQFQRNYDLISFQRWTDEEAMDMTSSNPIRNWDIVRSIFNDYEFKSITENESWKKFYGTFDHLFGETSI